MAKVYIFTNTDLASDYDELIQDEYLSEQYGDKIFLTCEDSTTLIMNEEEDTVFIQEYFEQN